jgi:hypothetical protein
MLNCSLDNQKRADILLLMGNSAPFYISCVILFFYGRNFSINSDYPYLKTSSVQPWMYSEKIYISYFRCKHNFCIVFSNFIPLRIMTEKSCWESYFCDIVTL